MRIRTNPDFFLFLKRFPIPINSKIIIIGRGESRESDINFSIKNIESTPSI